MKQNGNCPSPPPKKKNYQDGDNRLSYPVMSCHAEERSSMGGAEEEQLEEHKDMWRGLAAR